MAATKKTEYKITPLTEQHLESTLKLFTKAFCDSEPATQHLHISHQEYEPFVRDVLKKAIKDGMSLVAVDKDKNVAAFVIAEDITDYFTPNIARYPKLEPIFALMQQLFMSFIKDKKILPGKIAHIWIDAVDPSARGKGLSTLIDIECTKRCAKKGYDFAYTEMTNPISENVIPRFEVTELENTIEYDSFTYEGKKPFKGLKGRASAYILGINPKVTLDDLSECYTTETQSR